MNKQEMISAIAEKANVTKVDAEKMLKAFIDVTKDTVASGDEVSFIGFGTFSAVKRAERDCRNPQTGDVIKKEATVVPKFKPGKDFKAAVANGKSKK